MDKYHFNIAKSKTKNLFTKICYVGFYNSKIHKKLTKKVNCVEILYITEGESQIEINQEKILTHRGDLHIFLPGYDISFPNEENLEQSGVYFGIKATDYLIEQIANAKKSIVHTKSNTQLFDNLFASLFNEARRDASSPQIEHFVNIILLKMLIFSSGNVEEESTLFFKIKKYLDENFYENISLDSLQSTFSLSKFYLLRMFKDYAGCTPMKYVTFKKIEEAKRLILNSNLSVENIAEKLGFDDKYYFSRTFTKIVGISPYKYNRGFLKKEETYNLEVETRIIYNYMSGQYWPAAQTKIGLKKEEQNMIKKANDYINNKDNYSMMNNRYRPKYHFSVPIGWLNDPNGFVEMYGLYHLMFQYDPYYKGGDSGIKYWGHATTTDFIHWKNEPVAIAPDQDYDKGGCWSGSSITVGSRIYTMYTGYVEGIQQQCIAVSENGATYVKNEQNPVITSQMLPDHCDIYAFRDPSIIQKDNTFYCGCAAHDTRDFGKILLYKSKDLKQFEYVGQLIEEHISTGLGMFECPNFANIDGFDVLLSSINWSVTQDYSYENFASVVGYTGKIDYENCKFDNFGAQQLDFGLDFYATQLTQKTHDNRHIMVAWLQMWERTFPTQVDGWVGSITIPREISIKDNHIYQRPVRELDQYCFLKNNLQTKVLQNTSLSYPHTASAKIYFEANIEKCDRFVISLFKSEDEEATLIYDKSKGTLEFSRLNMKNQIEATSKLESQGHTRSYKLKDNTKISLNILLDVSTVEIFVNDGYATMTSNVYPIRDKYSLQIINQGQMEIQKLQIFEIKI